MNETIFKYKSLIIGNRGVKSKIMENTLESILYAIEMGVDGIKIDIQSCFTGEIILFHDKTLDRLAFKDEFYFNKIQNKRVNKLRWYHIYNSRLIDVMGKQYEIPKLIDILYDPRVIDSNILINIEIKDKISHENLCDLLTRVIDEGLYEPSRFMISSDNINPLIYINEFKIESIKESQKYNNFKIGYTFSQVLIPRKHLMENIKKYCNIITHVILNKYLINKSIIDYIKNMGLDIFAYINDKDTIENIENSIDGIITDKPKIFM